MASEPVSRPKGFTLLELLVVLAVLGILIGIAVPRIKGMQDQGRVTRAQSEVKALQAALEAYYIHQRSFPAGTDTICASALIPATPQLIKAPLYDPFGATATSEYKYLVSSNRRYYVVFSAGLPGQSQPAAISDAGDISF